MSDTDDYDVDLSGMCVDYSFLSNVNFYESKSKCNESCEDNSEINSNDSSIDEEVACTESYGIGSDMSSSGTDFEEGDDSSGSSRYITDWKMHVVDMKSSSEGNDGEINSMDECESDLSAGI
jgi:hypothetical protein